MLISKKTFQDGKFYQFVFLGIAGKPFYYWTSHSLSEKDIQRPFFLWLEADMCTNFVRSIRVPSTALADTWIGNPITFRREKLRLDKHYTSPAKTSYAKNFTAPSPENVLGDIYTVFKIRFPAQTSHVCCDAVTILLVEIVMANHKGLPSADSGKGIHALIHVSCDQYRPPIGRTPQRGRYYASIYIN